MAEQNNEQNSDTAREAESWAEQIMKTQNKILEALKWNRDSSAESGVQKVTVPKVKNNSQENNQNNENNNQENKGNQEQSQSKSPAQQIWDLIR